MNNISDPRGKSQSEVLNLISDGIVCVDKKWRYTFLNDAALATHPESREETLGRVIWDVHPEMHGTIFWDKYHEAMEFNRTVDIDSYYAPMDIWFSVKVYPSDEGLTIFYMNITSRKKAEVEIMHSKQRQQAILENTNDIIWSVDKDLKLLFCNSLFRNFSKILTGTEVELGKNILQFIPISYDPDLAQLYVRALGGEPFSIEQTGRAHETALEYFFNPIRDEHQEISGVAVYLRDITERKKSKEQLIESESRYRSLVEQMKDAIFVSNDKGEYVEVNISACALLGYSRDELLKLTAKDVLFSDESISKLPERFATLRSGNSTLTENKLKRKDGSSVDVEINTRMLSDGRFVGIVRDITERKRAAEELDRSEKRFRALVENSVDIIAMITAEGQSIYRSPSANRITGITLEDRNNGNAINDIHPDDLKAMGETLERCKANPGKAIPLVFRTKHKEGHYIWFEGTFTNRLDDANVNAIIINIRDITARKLADDKLVANEQRFRALIENISDAIVLNDEKSNLIFQSSSVTRILGYTVDERKGKPILNYVHPNNRNEFVGLYDQLRENPGKPFSFQYQFLHKNGNYIWLEGVVTNLLHDPTVNAYVANYRDISERKEAEEKLMRERTLLRTLIDNLPDYIYVKDEALRYLVNNKANVGLMGFQTEDDTIGKTSDEIFGDRQDIQDYKNDPEILTTGKSVMYREEVITTNEGIKFLLSTKIPLTDAHQNVVGLIGISRDITKQKQVELDLRNLNYFLESAQTVGKIGYWISEIEKEGELIWSPETCSIFGLKPEDFDGKIETFFKLVHPEDLTKVNLATTTAIQNNEIYSIDHRIVLPSGEIKWVHEKGEATFNETGQVLQLIGIVQDITERKLAENEILELNTHLEARVKLRTEQLQAANKEMEAFTYSVSHDLRSPLRIIDGYSQILIEDYTSKLDEEGVKTLDIIMTNAKKMGQLIDDLLEFSKIGRTELRRSLVNMNDLVGDVINDLQLGGTIIPEGMNILPLQPLNCDPNLLRHVWVNLISNAIKYSSAKENPEIEIGMHQSHDGVAYYIKDNGAGFDMQYYHKLFGVFQRLHSHHEFSGTGVGLAIVQRIILRHGGKVWAESKLNGGATFFFSLTGNEN